MKYFMIWMFIFLAFSPIFLNAAAKTTKPKFEFSKAALLELRKDADPKTLSIIDAYEEAVALEKEIAGLYREIKAAQLSAVQKQQLQKSLEMVMVPKAQRQKFDREFFEKEGEDAQQIQKYKEQVKEVMRETDNIVSNSRKMLEELLDKKDEEDESTDATETEDNSATDDSSSTDSPQDSTESKQDQLTKLSQQEQKKTEEAAKAEDEAAKAIEEAKKQIEDAKKIIEEKKKEDQAPDKKEEEKVPEEKTAEEKKAEEEKVAEKEEAKKNIEEAEKAVTKAEDAVKEAEKAIKKAAENVKDEKKAAQEKKKEADKAMVKLAEAIKKLQDAQTEVAKLEKKEQDSKADTKKTADAKKKTDDSKESAEAAKKHMGKAVADLTEAAKLATAQEKLSAVKLAKNTNVAKKQALAILSMEDTGKFMDLTQQMKGKDLKAKLKPVPPEQRPPSLKFFKGTSGQKIVSTGGKSAIWFYLDNWYIIGPYVNPGRKNIEKVYPPQSIRDLDAVYRDSNGRELRWDYDSFAKEIIEPWNSAEYAIFYAYTELYCDKPMDLWIAVGSDDRSDIWINDLPVWRSSNHLKSWSLGEGFRKVHFKKGVNRILYRIENGWRGMAFSLLVNTGKPPEGTPVPK